jgi:hypothetical protein
LVCKEERIVIVVNGFIVFFEQLVEIDGAIAAAVHFRGPLSVVCHLDGVSQL